MIRMRKNTLGCTWIVQTGPAAQTALYACWSISGSMFQESNIDASNKSSNLESRVLHPGSDDDGVRKENGGGGEGGRAASRARGRQRAIRVDAERL